MNKILILLFLMGLVASESYAQSFLKSTLEDQSSLEVTVYNSNLGLIKDTRKIELSQGVGELRFMDVASTIQPVSVNVKSVNQPDQFSILEQNYEYDLMDHNKMMEKYVGKTIKLMVVNKYQDRKEMVDAKLLAFNGQPIYEINGEIHLGHDGYKILPEIPENLIDKPTLAWMVENGSAQSHEVQVSYLANSLNWKADYVVNVSPDDKKIDLNGWVSVDNLSGATYKDAKLKLVAGDVNRVHQHAYRGDGMVLMEMKRTASAPQFQQEKFFEYQIYDLQRKTTLKNNQTKQILFTESYGANATKEFIVRAQGNYYGLFRGENKLPVQVYMKFLNSQENNLGQPLPAGIMRLYKEDHDGSLQFIGEDRIKHTPKDEEIKLKMGNAFDVVAERKQTNYKRLSKQLHESDWEIKIRNHKDEAIQVQIQESLSGNWEIIQSSHGYDKESAFQVYFNVVVQPNEEVIVTYRVRVGI